MRKRTTFVFALLLLTNSFFAQEFVSSNLPIIVISTNGQAIVDEPKVTARMQIFDHPDQRNNISTTPPEYDGLIGIELRGQTSQTLFPKKGYGIETRHSDGTDLDTSILKLPRESDWVIHSPYSDKSLMRNALAYMLADEIMVYAPRVRMAELVINNDYKGVVIWTEKIKRDKNRVDISKLNIDENEGDNLTGGYILKFDKEAEDEIGWISSYEPLYQKKTRFLYHYPKPEDITFEQKSYIRGYMDKFEDVLMSEDYDDPITGYAQYIDVKSFISTIIINELTRNVDGYRLSTYMYKDKDSNGGKLAMGPTWDHNLSWGNANYCSGASTSGWASDFNLVCPDDYWVNHVWWNRLLSDENFRRKLKDKWAELRQGVFSTPNLHGRIDSLVQLLGEAAPRNFNRWPVLGQYVWPNQYIGQNFQEEISYLKDWIEQRTRWLDQNFDNLTTPVIRAEEVENPRIYPNPTMGTIYIEDAQDIKSAEFYTMTGQFIQTVSIDRSSVSIEINPVDYTGLIWYRLLKENGSIITGKLYKIRK